MNEEIKKEGLEELTLACAWYKSLEKGIADLEKELKILQCSFEVVSRKTIPEILSNSGLSEIRLQSGEKIKVSEKIYASIPEKNYGIVLENVITSDGADYANSIFKSKVIIENKDDDFLRGLISQGIDYDLKISIHPQTLKKYVSDKLSRGENIPDGISVFTYQEAQIK